jgi:hypothetical protein
MLEAEGDIEESLEQHGPLERLSKNATERRDRFGHRMIHYRSTDKYLDIN